MVSAAAAIAAAGLTPLGIGIAVGFAVSLAFNLDNAVADGKYTKSATGWIGDAAGLGKEGKENLHLATSLTASGIGIAMPLLAGNPTETIKSMAGMIQLPVTLIRGYNDVEGSQHRKRGSIHEKKVNQCENSFDRMITDCKDLLESQKNMMEVMTTANDKKETLTENILRTT